MGLVIDQFPLAFLVHEEDVLLPVVVGSRNTDPNVGNEGGVACRDPHSDGVDHGALFLLLILSPRQLGFLFQLLKVDSGRVAAHAHLVHFPLVDFFDSGVAEFVVELFYKF